MTKRFTRICDEPGCGTELNRWRACGVKGCACETAYCDEHGGDLQAIRAMENHHREGHGMTIDTKGEAGQYLNLPHIAADVDFGHMILLCDDLLTRKGHDYTQGAEGDRGRLKNFYTASERLGLTPRQVLSVYLHKHLTGIETFLQYGKVESEAIEGRIADTINYLLLLHKMNRYEERESRKKEK